MHVVAAAVGTVEIGESGALIAGVLESEAEVEIIGLMLSRAARVGYAFDDVVLA